MLTLRLKRHRCRGRLRPFWPPPRSPSPRWVAMSQAAASKAKSQPAASTKEKKKATSSKDDRYDETRTVLCNPMVSANRPGVQGIGHGLQWPCQVGRLREVPPPPVVHASIRGDWTSPTGRSIAGGHEAPDRGAWREGSLQPLVEQSGSGPGRSRAFLADQARSHPCSQGGDWVLCSPHSQHQRDLESGNTNGDGHPRWRKARLPWLPRMFRLWSKTS